MLSLNVWQQERVTDMQISCGLLMIQLKLQKHTTSRPLQARHSGVRSQCLQQGKFWLTETELEPSN